MPPLCVDLLQTVLYAWLYTFYILPICIYHILPAQLVSESPHKLLPRSFRIKVKVLLQVYAYTASQLQTAILRLFTRCECILPNLFVGILTRESVVGALASSLSADQIVGYLRQHAHPHVAGRSPVVPEVSFLL